MISRAAQYGGTVVYPAHTAAIALNAHSKKMHVVVAAGNLNFTLPDARLFKIGGPHFVVGNGGSGGFTVTVKDAAGTTLTTLADGAAVKLSLQANGTSAGTWILDARSFTAVGTAKPDYSLVFGEDTTGGDRPSAVRYDYVGDVCTESSLVPSGQTDDFYSGGVAAVSGAAHRVVTTAQASGFSSQHTHVEYSVDTWTLRSEAPAVGSAGGDQGQTAVTISNAIVFFPDPEANIQEWDVTDSWTSLGGYAFGTTGAKWTSNFGWLGPIAGDVFLKSTGSNAPSNHNGGGVWNRTTETIAESLTNPLVSDQNGGGRFAIGDFAHTVGGDHFDASVPDTLHYKLDMSGGLTGTWSVATSHPVECPYPGGTTHPTNAQKATLMGGTGSTFTSSSNDVWSWDDVGESWLELTGMSRNRRYCASHACNITNA